MYIFLPVLEVQVFYFLIKIVYIQVCSLILAVVIIVEVVIHIFLWIYELTFDIGFSVSTIIIKCMYALLIWRCEDIAYLVVGSFLIIVIIII